MFPPKRTKEITKWLESMLSSLCRAGLEMSGDIGLDPIEDEKYSIMVRTPHLVEQPAWGYMKDYIKQYALESGWRVEKIRQVRGAILILALKS